VIDQTTQAILTVGMPTLAVLVGILVNNSRLSDLRAHMDSRIDNLRDELNRRLDAIEHRLEQIEQKLSQHDSRITVLEERTNPLRSVR
jgi:predicted  nucleic acid-binding Zn-ribbon protein